MIRPSDIVLHKPSGETWVVFGVDYQKGELIPCGYPFPTFARLADCELVKECYSVIGQPEMYIEGLKKHGLDRFIYTEPSDMVEDVVEVVRCKDCVHAYNIEAERCSCDCIDSYYNQVGLNHFCSSGERRSPKETVRCNDCEYYDKGLCFHHAVNYVARDRDFSCDFGERKKQKERGDGDGDAE